MEKKFLRITQKGFENYTGPLSVYEFVDGVSIEAIPQAERDRIAATMTCIEVAENGKETIAGVAERLVTESANSAPDKEVFERQSVESKVEEEVNAAKKAMGDIKKIYTEEELDQVIESSGIAGLREIAAVWNVKNRSIPALRQMILDEQQVYIAKDGARREKQIKAIEDIARQTASEGPAADVIGEPEVEDTEDTKDIELDAAATGDLSAAISEQNGSVDPASGDE